MIRYNPIALLNVNQLHRFTMKTIIFAFVAAFCFTISVHAQTGVPPIVSNGLTAYKESGGKAALAVWLRGSPMENDTTTNIRLLMSLCG